MKTIDEICRELKLTPEQSTGIKDYMIDLVIDLLESLKEDNLKNFDETIENLKNSNQSHPQ